MYQHYLTFIPTVYFEIELILEMILGKCQPDIVLNISLLCEVQIQYSFLFNVLEINLHEISNKF